ncbi:MAG: hypothetical protein ABIK28_03230 [Planctomycetota bacterium]
MEKRLGLKCNASRFPGFDRMQAMGACGQPFMIQLREVAEFRSNFLADCPEFLPKKGNVIVFPAVLPMRRASGFV